jgi:hypothetical protein
VLKRFCDWLSNTPISQAFQDWTWFVPLVQTVHILAIAVVLFSVYAIGFRLIGLTRARQPFAVMTRKSLPWTWTGLAVLLVTGVLLTITEPARELLNSVADPSNDAHQSRVLDGIAGTPAQWAGAWCFRCADWRVYRHRG